MNAALNRIDKYGSGEEWPSCIPWKEEAVPGVV